MNRTRFHASTWLLTLLVLSGCSTVQTSDMPPDELQDQIATEQIVRPGDHVSVTTIQGLTYDLEIIQVTEENIKGLADVPVDQLTIDDNAEVSMQTVQKSPVEIPLTEISTIQTRELTPAEKAAATAGGAGALVAAGGIMYFMYVLLPTLVVSALVSL